MKGVLVIDMPPTCWDCPVCSEGYCMADVSIENKDFETSRDARCPLKEVPKRKGLFTEMHEYDTDIHYEIGWNACVDYLEGDDDGS